MHDKTVCVIGAGIFGLWTSYFLLEQGFKVILIDSAGAGNSESTSGGITRIIRRTYGSDQFYSEKTNWSYAFWEDLKDSSGLPLFHKDGVYWIGDKSNEYIQHSQKVFENSGWKLTKLSGVEHIGFKGLKYSDSNVEFIEPDAGFVKAELACKYLFDRLIPDLKYWAIDSFASLHSDKNEVLSIKLKSGVKISADHFIFCCGPWLKNIFPDIFGQCMYVTRQESYLYDVSNHDFPFFSWVDMSGERIIYGVFNPQEKLLKIADDTRDSLMDLKEPKRELINLKDRTRLENYFLNQFGVDIGSNYLGHKVCQYSNSNNGDFIIDKHPDFKNVIVCGAGSGHGFKMSPYIGYFTANLLETGQGLDRFRISSQPLENKRHTQFEN